MATFGQGVNASLGKTDYSNYLAGALQGAKGVAAGGSAIGQGIANLGEQVGAGIKQYYEKKEAKEKSSRANNLVKELIKKNPAFIKDTFGQDIDPTDEGLVKTIVETIGVEKVIKLKSDFTQAEEQKTRDSRVANIVGLLDQGNGSLEGSGFNASDFDQQNLQKAKSIYANNQFINERIGATSRSNRPTPNVGTASARDYSLAVKQGYTGSFIDFKKDISSAGSSITNINMPGDIGKMKENAYNQLFKARTDEIDPLLSTRPAIEAMKVLINNTDEKGELITGAMANLELGAKSILNDAGLSNFTDVARTQEYLAQSVNLVGQIIKQFGAGTGLSDADREFAQQAAAGFITMDQEALKRLVDIAEQVNQYKIDAYNDRISRTFKGEDDTWARDSLLVPKSLMSMNNTVKEPELGAKANTQVVSSDIKAERERRNKLKGL